MKFKVISWLYSDFKGKSPENKVENDLNNLAILGYELEELVHNWKDGTVHAILRRRKEGES